MKNAVNVKEFFLNGVKGIQLHARFTQTTNDKANVIIVHGVGEHLGRYSYLVEALTKKGFNCIQYDHRGFGRSSGIRADVVDFNDYVDDLNIVLGAAKGQGANLPVYVFGHSMGSLITLYHLIKYPKQWDKVIVSGVPLILKKPVPRWMESIARVASKVFPTFTIASDIDPSVFTHDENVVSETRKDPLMQTKVTLRWGVCFIDSIHFVNSRLSLITDEILILHGEADKISDVRGARYLYENISSEKKQLNIYPGLYHELHNEKVEDRNKVFDDLINWLAK